jgi:dihydroceramide fatty acyl 2-hydroxylase
VLPPVLFIILYYVAVESILKRIIVFEDPILEAAFWSAFLIYYAIYDMFHYAMHFADMTKHKGSPFYSLFQKMQKYHLTHHFSGEDAGFGVSSPLWDIVFRSGFKRHLD